MTSRSNLARRPSLGDAGLLWQTIEEQLLEAAGEITPEIDAMLEALDNLEGEKVDGYVSLAKDLAGKAAGARAELKVVAEPLQRTIKACENAVERLKERMGRHLELRGKDRLAGSIYRARFQANGQAPAMQVLVPASDLPDPYRHVTYQPNLEALAAAIPADADRSKPVEITLGMLLDLAEDDFRREQVIATQAPKGRHVRFE